MKESPGELELLSSRVDDLERRVHALEHPEKSTTATLQPGMKVNLDASDTTSALETGNLFPILGRAMLGVAGAYVLRAIAETGKLPRLPISALAVIYAFAWLVWSPRGRGSLAKTVYAGTSALILIPLLWENTLRFHVFTPPLSAGILAAFLTLGTLLAVRSGSARSMWIAQALAVFTSSALAFATQHVLPFVIALLIGLVVSEFARVRGYAQPLWPLLALVADTAIWGLIFIYAGAENTRAAYPSLGPAALIAPAFVLFAIDGSSIVVRALVQTTRINLFEAIQVTIAFLLAVGGVLVFGSQHAVAALGVFSLVLAACTYVATLRYLRHSGEPGNVRVFGLWSAALLIAGSLWALPHVAAVVLAIAAVAATYLARRMEPVMLEFHAALFLVAAMMVARLPQYIFDAVGGSLPSRPAASMGIVALCAALVFVVAKHEAATSWQRALQFIPTLLAVCVIVALLVHGGMSVAALFLSLEAHHIAFLRTFTICVAALALAFGGSRWARIELTHIAYVALAFIAAKLLFEDLRHGHMEFIGGSIAFFAVALIAAPRLVRLGARLRANVRQENPVHSHN